MNLRKCTHFKHKMVQKKKAGSSEQNLVMLTKSLWQFCKFINGTQLEVE